MGKRLTIAISFVLLFHPLSAERAERYPSRRNPLIEIVEAAEARKEPQPAYETRTVWVTAYSSTPEETDDTPFITANGSTVRDGIVAVNFLPFGTKIKIPKMFGEKVFVVADRMHMRKVNAVDVWMQTKESAKHFGITYTEIVIIRKEDIGKNSQFKIQASNH